MSLEHIKLRLLTKSKQLLMAAEEQDWERFEQLNRNWNGELQQAEQSYGEALEAIRPQLIADNQAVIENIEQAQKELAQEFNESSRSNRQIKAYLK